jgi:hypothetical protein
LGLNLTERVVYAHLQPENYATCEMAGSTYLTSSTSLPCSL